MTVTANEIACLQMTMISTTVSVDILHFLPTRVVLPASNFRPYNQFVSDSAQTYSPVTQH